MKFVISIFSFLRKLHSAFHSGSTNGHAHQQGRTVPISPHPQHHLLFLVFWMAAIPTAVRWYLAVVLICISLMISDVERLFMSLLATCTSPLEKRLFRSSAHVLIRLSLWWLLHEFFIYLGVCPLLDISFASATLSYHRLPFFSFMESFAVRKLFRVM